MTGPHADKTKPRDRRLGVLLIIAGIIYYGVIAMFCSRRSAAMRFRRNAFLRFDDLLRGDAEAQMFGNVEELYGLGDRAGLIRRRDGAEISGGECGQGG
jgi:hypothetical protein